jgi:sugar phosphate isomerase/epimerase
MSPAQISLALALASVLPAQATPSPAPIQFGLQLWSLDGGIKHNPAATLDQVKSWGFVDVETAGTGPLSAEQFRGELDKRGLRATVSHVSYDTVAKDPDAAIREIKALGATIGICAWIPHQGAFTPALASEAAACFNRCGAAFRAAGLRFGYHPHGYEFISGTEPDRTLFDDFVSQLDPDNVVLEMDVFWVTHAGQDPVTLLNRYPTRWVALHIKDLRIGAPQGLTTGSAPATDKVVVGTGSIDWQAVIATAQRIGVAYYFIEDESPDPIAQIPRSLKFLRDLKTQP